MAIEIVYEVDCHCGGTATSTTLALGQPEEDGRVHIDVDLSIGQTEFECDDCGCTYYTGDIDVASDDEDDCAGPDVDAEDDEDDES